MDNIKTRDGSNLALGVVYEDRGCPIATDLCFVQKFTQNPEGPKISFIYEDGRTKEFDHSNIGALEVFASRLDLTEIDYNHVSEYALERYSLSQPKYTRETSGIGMIVDKSHADNPNPQFFLAPTPYYKE